MSKKFQVRRAAAAVRRATRERRTPPHDGPTRALHRTRCCCVGGALAPSQCADPPRSRRSR
eukprot:4279094-Prymnesium_polylepis.1